MAITQCITELLFLWREGIQLGESWEMCSASTAVVGPRKVQQVRSEEDKQPQGMTRAGRRNQGTLQQGCQLEPLLRQGKLAPPQGGGKVLPLRPVAG